MPMVKTIVKKAPRKRGSVSLARVRRAVASVLAKNGASSGVRPSRKARPAKSSKPSRTARISH